MIINKPDSLISTCLPMNLIFITFFSVTYINKINHKYAVQLVWCTVQKTKKEHTIFAHKHYERERTQHGTSPARQKQPVFLTYNFTRKTKWTVHITKIFANESTL